jgi:diguanylate cyclase (GGDEF)-like protein/PAS domain S-box-containing protein
MGTKIAVDQYFDDADMLRTMLDNIADGVYFTDTTRTIQYWNKGAELISGFSAAEVLGRRCADKILMHVDAQGNCLCTSPSCPLVKCLKGEKNHVERVYLHHKQGHRVPVRICASPIRNAAGEIIGGLETFHDVSSEMAALQEVDVLKEEALLCPLTGVGNRRYCDQVLETQMAHLSDGKPSLGLLFLDIDKFKHINDHHGHAVGDIVLKMVARTISRDLRGFDFVGRWGGEEFIAVLPRMLPTSLEATAERLRILIERSSAKVSDGKLSVTASIGATMAKPGETTDTLVARADALMYQSKEGGRNRVTVG